MKYLPILLFLLTSSLFYSLEAQSNLYYPDVIIQTTGKEINCRILSFDNTRFEIAVYSFDREVETYVGRDKIASYTYKGREVILGELVGEEVQVPEEMEVEPDELPLTRKADTTVIKTNDEGVSPDPDQIELATKPVRKITGSTYDSRIYHNTEQTDWKKPYYSLHTDGQPKYVFRFAALPPGFQWEARLKENTVMVASAWMGFSYQWSNYSGSTLYLQPGVSLCPRFYRNLERRADLGKRVDYYSGFYLGVPASAIYVGYLYTSLGFVTGFQRTLGRKGYWNIYFGPGIAGFLPDYKLTFIGEITLGFILSE
ncbi:MAG: hypothetical protein JW801_17330 [Bacteroidales bacterium]|nr:hypothetical protein [Bacteroidales bacterium]